MLVGIRGPWLGCRSMHRFIRYRLVTIVILGVLTSALSVFGLVQLLSTTTAQRIERARDSVQDETHRLAEEGASVSDASATTFVGLRAGISTSAAFDRDPGNLPAVFVGPIGGALKSATASHTRIATETTLPEGTIVVNAMPMAHAEGIAFSAYLVKPLASLSTWQHIVTALAMLTVLLTAVAVYSIVAASRGAAALKESLRRLASDLRAPIARPPLGELDAISDGIKELANKLADARDKEVKLARELSHNERLAALGRVAAGVAHEVRNPLASIKLRLDLAMAASANLPPVASEAIRHATSEIDRLDRLVADLLVITGRHVGDKRRTDVGALVHARADGLAPWAKERSVRIAVTGEGTAAVDLDAISRAIDNLLRNAVEASPANGVVRVQVARVEDRVTVDVEDEGVGVVNGAAELFEPFFTTKPSGTGLGLAISRAIARGHGGDVVYRRHDRTTSFMLSFTVSDPSTAKVKVPHSEGVEAHA